MASWLTLLLLLCISLEHAESSFVQVKCSAKNVGYYGHQSLLECAVQTSPDASDAKIRGVTWTNGVKEPLLAFYNGVFLMTKPGYRFAEPSWNENNMNISMLITNTTVAHDGLYFCDVITSNGLAEKSTCLEVQAKYSKPSVTSKPEKIIPNTRSSLICESHGGYPKGQLRWFDKDEAEWTRSAEMKVEQTADGLFQLTSTLPLMPGSTLPRYICVLYNASGSKENEVVFDIPDYFVSPQSVQTSKILAPVLVIGSLIVGLLMALLVYRKRTQRARRPSAAPLMGFATVPPRDFDDGDRQFSETVTKPKDSMA